MAKAESLYNICDFEHSLLLFTRSQRLAPDCSLGMTGILKCKKTISNKIYQEDVFFFRGSKYFLDHLRREGGGGVDAFLTGQEQSFRAVSSLASIKQKMKKMKDDKVEGKKKNGGRKDRMREDKIFLKNLEKTIKPMAGKKKDLVR